MTSFSFKQLLASASLALLALGGRSESEVQYCRESNQFLAAPEGAGGRKYAPSREIDILHLAIDVTPDFKARSIAAETTLRFKPIAKPLSELTLDAVDLNVSSVGSSEKIGGWHASDHDITVVFDPPIPVDKEASVNIRYEAFPKKGL